MLETHLLRVRTANPNAVLAAWLGALAAAAILASIALVPVGPLIGIHIGSASSILAGIGFFIVFTFVASSVAAASPAGGVMDGASASIFAAAALGGPLAGAAVALIGATQRRELSRGFPWYGLVSNHAVLALAGVAAGLGANAVRAGLSASSADQPIVSVLAVLASIVLGTVVNELGVGVVLAVRNRRPLVAAIRDFLPWQVTKIGSDGAIAILLVAVYGSAEWWLTPAFVVPILAVALGFRRYQAAWEADHDPLTGAILRRDLGRRLAVVLAEAPRAARRTGLLVVDVDKFKTINDTYGHETGDRVLREVAARLGAGIRPVDSLARIGGDEFVIILAGVDTDLTLMARAEGLRATVAAPMPIDDHEFHVGLSLGGVMVPLAPPAADVILAAADAAMYEAKRSGGGCRLSATSLAAVDGG